MRKLYNASFAHIITVFKNESQQNMNFTQKQKYNIYYRTFEADAPEFLGLDRTQVQNRRFIRIADLSWL